MKTKNIWTLLSLFKTYVRPKLEHNSTIWSPYLLKDFRKIESIQRTFTKWACLRCSIPFNSYQDRLEKLNLETLEYRRLYSDLVLLYKIFYNYSYLKFSDYFSMRSSPYMLRGSNLKIDAKFKFKTTQFQNLFFNRVPPVWNQLPADITSEKSIDAFKLKLKRFNLCTIAKLRTQS